MPEDYFGEGVAERYDTSSADMFEPDVVGPVVDFLAELAGDGAALELGDRDGPDRIAAVASAAFASMESTSRRTMVAKLREKPERRRIEVAIGDFATTRVDGTFSLAYLVFNTINNLTTQDEQVACFQNVAAHLEPGGCFVIEVGVPGLRTLPPGKWHQVFAFGADHIGIDEYDPANQGLVSHHLFPAGDEWELRSIPFRYVWPAELDLMARLAGMTLHERWSGWKREPFTSESTKHVSVWQKTA